VLLLPSLFRSIKTGLVLFLKFAQPSFEHLSVSCGKAFRRNAYIAFYFDDLADHDRRMSKVPLSGEEIYGVLARHRDAPKSRFLCNLRARFCSYVGEQLFAVNRPGPAVFD